MVRLSLSLKTINAKLITTVFGTEAFFNAKCLRQPGKQLNARILENNSVVSWQCSIPFLDVLDSRKFCEINFSVVNFGRFSLANGKNYPKLYYPVTISSCIPEFFMNSFPPTLSSGLWSNSFRTPRWRRWRKN